MNINLRQITSKLSTRGWLTIGGAALIGLAFVYLLMTMASAPSYTTLLTGQTPAQTAKITSALSTAGIQYELQNNGTAVAVQTSQEGQARDTLGNQGLLSGGGGEDSTLWQLIGNQSLGESNQQQLEQATSAEEQQLQQTIENLNGINSASVQLAIPDEADNLFSGTNTETTASVELNDTGTLGSTEIKAIAALVANAVPNLNLNHVSITDQDGDYLWPNGSDSGSATTVQSQEMQYDAQQEQAADTYMNNTLGPGLVQVAIYATLNPNSQTVQSVTYAPKGVPLSTSKTIEKLKGNPSAANAAGTTGTKIASYAGNSGGTTTYSNSTLTTNYGDSKTISSANIPPGELKSQTISILVNKNVPAAELPNIRAAIENQVGFKKKRDTVSIAQVAFAKQTTTPASSSSSPGLGDLKYVLVGLGSVLFLLFISRLLRRRETDNFAGRPTWLRELETPRSLAELESQTQMVDLDAPQVVARLRSPVNLARQQVEELVDRDPERVAAQIRQWMTED